MDIRKLDDGTYTLRVDHPELYEIFKALTVARHENLYEDADVQDAIIPQIAEVLPD